MRGKTVFFVCHITIPEYAWESPKEGERIQAMSAIFPWMVGDILFDLPDGSCLGYKNHSPMNRAVCFDAQKRKAVVGNRMVWLRDYFSNSDDRELSGIFTTQDDAETRVSLIKLTCRSYRGDFLEFASEDTMKDWCRIRTFDCWDDLGDFSKDS